MINCPHEKIREDKKYIKTNVCKIGGRFDFYLLVEKDAFYYDQFLINVRDGIIHFSHCSFFDINYFISQNKTTILIGLYAYNYFLYISGLHKEESSSFSLIDIPFYEIISVNYREDCLYLIEFLQSNMSDITYKEFYPFFQYTDFSVNIYYKNSLIIKIYGNNNKRIPFIESDLCNFYTKKKNSKLQIKLGTFSIVLLYGYIKMYWERANNNTFEQTNYYAFITQLISIRNYYLKKNKKNLVMDI